jgi:hypothetical protein
LKLGAPTRVPAEHVLAVLLELETVKNVHDRLRTLRGRLGELRARLSTEGWSEAELRWRRPCARDGGTPAASAFWVMPCPLEGAGLARLEVAEDGEHPPVVGGGRGEVELGEDRGDVLFYAAAGQVEPVGDGGVGAALGE